MNKKIIIVGAGYAGVLTAKKLAKKIKKLGKAGETEITIIDKNPFHTMLTELHEVAAWRVEEDSIKISLERVFAGRKVNVVLDNVTSIDYAAKNVVCENQTLSYDYLVMASGSQPVFFGVPGAEEHSFTLWSFDDAVILREHIMNMFREAAREPVEAKKRAYLTFFVVGCGFTGVEMAGELAELVPSLCDRFEIDPSLVTVVDMDMLDRVCTILPEKLSDKVVRRLKKMRVNVELKASTTAVGPDYIEYKKDNKVIKVATKTVIWTAGVQGSDIAKASDSLGGVARGRIQTDEYLRSEKDKNVYIAGDNMYYIPEGEKESVPQMVENCEACADTIAHNLICDLTNNGEKEKYAPKFHGVMVCIGGRYGVAHVGLPGKFFGLPSFLAMFSKHFINVLYYLQVLGWNKIFSYIKHEFFTIRNCRSFLGGHFSNRSPSFFLVPLRMWLGCFWLYEGIKKVGEGWLQSPKLTGFYSGANAFYDNVINGPAAGAAVASASGAAATASASGAATTAAASGAADAVAATTAAASGAATTAAADAVAAATGAATTAAASGAADAVAAASGAAASTGGSWGDLLLNWDILGIIKVIYVYAGDFALKIQVSFIDFFMDNLVLPYDGVQLVFQIGIVLAEILVGLALIAGLFTTVSAVVSLILQTMFLTSTGLYMATWWMFFAGIAMLFGAGRVFSMDYYVLPYLKRWWKNLGFIKKWYLYHD